LKKLIIVALSVVGFLLIAAPTAVEFYPVYLNGHFLGNARNFNGIIVVSVQDLAKAGGGTLTLEQAGLTLNGGVLSAYQSGGSGVTSKAFHKASVAGGGTNAYKEQTAYKETPAEAKVHVKATTNALFKVNKSGKIAMHTVNGDGKVWVALSDVAKAFGGAFILGNLKPGESIQLHFPANPNAILIGLL
jgi:type IV secretory pathway TrbL component